MRRLFWIGVGVGSTLYTQKRVKDAVGEVTAANVGREAVRVARRVGEDVARNVGSAVTEGRDAARREERILRSELGLRPDPLRVVDVD